MQVWSQYSSSIPVITMIFSNNNRDLGQHSACGARSVGSNHLSSIQWGNGLDDLTAPSNLKESMDHEV